MSTITVSVKELKEGWHVVIESEMMGLTAEGNPIAIVVGPMPKLVCNLYAPYYAAWISASDKVTITDETRERLKHATEALKGAGLDEPDKAGLATLIEAFSRLNERPTQEHLDTFNAALRGDDKESTPG